MLDFYVELWKINIDTKYSESGFKLTEDELTILATMKSHSLVGIITDWVQDGMHENYMKYFEQLKTVFELEAGYAMLSDKRMVSGEMNVVSDGYTRKRKCREA
ncbi:TetR/AcrR family transcriptional regulator C-terminal domain-containing protein [Hespellia stercorisuis]|uniref:TetR/AcrR family transcriptional regulator C-terminal domain-containing protein n=1 Tax=Hespellia stercorisuis TaxID=180311 RepID=UPI00241D61DE|nr:TetR/AcrR family transcriptional regulator C-terminal domain-containing protein [Hespellia stercorisuis]